MTDPTISPQKKAYIIHRKNLTESEIDGLHSFKNYLYERDLRAYSEEDITLGKDRFNAHSEYVNQCG